MGGGSGVVTNGSTMQEEPAEMEIPLEEEVAYSLLVSFLHVVTFLTKTSKTRTHEKEITQSKPRIGTLVMSYLGEQVLCTRATADIIQR